MAGKQDAFFVGHQPEFLQKTTYSPFYCAYASEPSCKVSHNQGEQEWDGREPASHRWKHWMRRNFP